MNAHIWELEKCENKNGKLLKSVMDEINLQILNCVWDSMKGATWFSENSEFTHNLLDLQDLLAENVTSQSQADRVNRNAYRYSVVTLVLFICK